MPFPEQPARTFDRTGIEQLNPDQYGCYGIYTSSQWVYVGKGDIRARLLDHLSGGNPCIARQAPTHFVAEVTAEMDAREKALIVELNPTCNQKVG